MLAVMGTIPAPDFPLAAGRAVVEGEALVIAGRRTRVNRGTAALLAAAAAAGRVLGLAAPWACVAGDIGRGEGSRLVYGHLTQHREWTGCRAVAFHYLQPYVEWHDRVLEVLRAAQSPRPTLIADAGFMYAAKMSGQAAEYDLFTPDIGELAFLADEEAPHPFYTRGFILHDEGRVPALIARAYAHGNAARWLLVKGERDYLAGEEGVKGIIDSHSEEAMEAIGGTGDTLTGIVAMLVAGGMRVPRAALLASRVNRLAGVYAGPTPATQVHEIIAQIPRALGELLAQEGRRTGKDGSPLP